ATVLRILMRRRRFREINQQSAGFFLKDASEISASITSGYRFLLTGERDVNVWRNTSYFLQKHIFTAEPILPDKAAKPHSPSAPVEPEQPAKRDHNAYLLLCPPSSHIHLPGSSFSSPPPPACFMLSIAVTSSKKHQEFPLLPWQRDWEGMCGQISSGCVLNAQI
ncbi:hypothetical protein GOODEAATRI_024788, partial [Goodea atripinnis]